MELKNSKTHENLMRALAGETLARARYEQAAQAALEAKLPVLAEVFRYTATRRSLPAISGPPESPPLASRQPSRWTR